MNKKLEEKWGQMDQDSVPEGQHENSPAFQRRAARGNGISPEGTAETSIPNAGIDDSSAVPSGLVQLRLDPGVKTPGYSHAVPSGRDRHDGCLGAFQFSQGL